MMVTFFLAVFTTASVTQTVSHSSLFQPFRNWLVQQASVPARKPWQRAIVAMPLCQYCLSHWIGAVVTLVFGLSWLAFFPVVWLANHSTIVYDLLANIPQVMRWSVEANAARAKAQPMSSTVPVTRE